MRVNSLRAVLLACTILLIVIIAGCKAPQRMGMVEDPQTGLQWGSLVEKNILIDSSQLTNKKIKLRIRNTSGDPAFDLHYLSDKLKQSYAQKGFIPTDSDNFGLLVDVNVMYSGQISRSLAGQFAFLGGSLGGVAGYRSDAKAGTALGIVSGVALGAIIGSYITDDTYIVITHLSIAVPDQEIGNQKTTIVFGDTLKREREDRSGFKVFKQRLGSHVAVYAGGRNTTQAEIRSGVRDRFERILVDII